MSRQAINRGTAPDDPTAETIYSAFGKVNAMTSELYTTRPFYVTDYGAVGDGSTDDTAAIQACIDAAETLVDSSVDGTGIVAFPGGRTYLIDDTLLVPPQGMRFVGIGTSSSIATGGVRLQWTGALNGIMFDVVAPTAQTGIGNVSFSNLNFFGNVGAADRCATFIRFRNETAGNVSSCDTGCYIDNCMFAGSGSHAVNIDSATNMYFNATRWDSCGVNDGGYGVYCHLRATFYCHFTGECSWQGDTGCGGFIFLNSEDVSSGTPFAAIRLDSFKVETGASLAALGTGKIGTSAASHEYDKRGVFRFGVNENLGSTYMHCFINGLYVEMTGDDGSMSVFQVTADSGTDTVCGRFVNIIVDGGLGLGQGSSDTATTSVIRPIGGRVPTEGRPPGSYPGGAARWGRFQYGTGLITGYGGEKVTTWIWNPQYYLKFAHNTVLGPVSTVANLNANPITGERAFVNDATATTFGSTVAGGGANEVPVYYSAAASAWKIG